MSAFTFDSCTSFNFFALQSCSAAGAPSHSGYTSETKRMFLPSGDQSSPLASVAIDVSLRTPVTLPAAASKSAIQTCDPPSLVEMNANRFPSGDQRGRSPSWSAMRIRSRAEEDAAELRSAWADEASPPTRGWTGETPVAPPAGASGTIQMCGVFLFAARSTSTALNSTHLPSGEGTGSPTRLRDIMSSNVNGRLACEKAGTT